MDVIEAGFPAASPGDFEAVQADRRRDPGQHRLRPGARQRQRYRSGRRGAQGSRRRAHPHVHRHLADPHGAQAAHAAGPGDRAGGQVGEARPPVPRRCRVFAGGCRALGSRFSVPDSRAGDQCGRDDDQHSRHGRLQHARAVRHPDPHACASASRTPTKSFGRCTATTISASRWPIRCPR